MPKPNPIAELAARLIASLKSRRDQGVFEPLRIRQLAAQMEPPADVADVLKALKKKPFADDLLAARSDPTSPIVLAEDSDRLAKSPALLDFALGQLYQPGRELHPLARVVAKVDKRLQPAFAAVLEKQVADNTLPPLAGVLLTKGVPRLYLKAFPPPPKPDEALAERLVQVLQTEKERGNYPLKLRELTACAEADNTPELKKALAHKAFQSQVVVAAARNVDAPVALASDLDQLVGSALLLEFAVGLLSTETKPLHPAAKVVAKVDARVREAFAGVLERRATARDLPASIAVVRVQDVAHFCLTPYLPRLAPEVELAGKLLQLLQDRRLHGDYPVLLARLIEEADPTVSPEVVEKALAARSFKPHVLLALPGDPQTPIALSGDVDQLARAPGLLEAVLAQSVTPDNQAVTPADLAKKLGKALRPPFVGAVDASVSASTLPATVGCVRIKAKPYLFRVNEVGARPQAGLAQPQAPPSIDFPSRFDEAFTEIDQRTGAHNFVSLVDLRRALAVDHSVFDAALHKLRQAGRYTLSGAEGRHGITAEELAAGVQENGALLLYVSRRRG